MAMRDFLLINGGLADDDAPAQADPIHRFADDLNIRRLPLAPDVIDTFVVVHSVPSPEPIGHPLEASRTVSLMPDGRFVCTEVSGHSGAVLGEPLRLSEAVDIANRVLQRGEIGQALDAHSLAVAFLGLIKTQTFPAARGGA